MKRKISIVVVLLVVFCGYFFASPYLAMSSIKDGIMEGDSETLEEYINFVSVRQGLKDQFNAVVMEKAAAESKDNPFGALGMVFATKIIEGAVDSFITPDGLSRLSQGNAEPQMKAGGSSGAGQGEKDEVFGNASYGFTSLSRFTVRVPSDNADEVIFTLRRSGLSWQLTKIALPLEKM